MESLFKSLNILNKGRGKMTKAGIKELRSAVAGALRRDANAAVKKEELKLEKSKQAEMKMKMKLMVMGGTVSPTDGQEADEG